MTLTRREAVSSIYGAWRLALLDAGGLAFLDRTPAGALRSFWAAALVAPAYLILVLLRFAEFDPPVPLGRLLLVQAIGYVVSWTAFPLAMYHVAGLIGRAERYAGYLSAYNWSAVIQMTVYLPALTLAHSGLLPGAAADLLLTGVTVALLVYQWFIARTALDIGGGGAVGIVLLDIVLAVFVSGIADGMSGAAR